MGAFREVSRWTDKSAYIQRKGDRILTTNKHILVIDDKNILKCMNRASIKKEKLENGLVYLFGFKNSSRGFNGFCIEDQFQYSTNTLSDYFNKLCAKGIELREGEIPFFSEDRSSFVGLTCSGGEGFLVNKKYREYVLNVTGADKIFAAFPVIYALKGNVVGAICQFNFFWNSKKEECDMKECFNSIYDAQKYCWNNLES